MKNKAIPKKYFIFLFYILYIIVNYIIINNTYDEEKKLWLQVFFCLVVISFVISLLCMKVCSIELFSISGIFIVFSYIFHFGQLFVIQLFPKYIYKGDNFIKLLEFDYLKAAYVFSLYTTLLVVLGILSYSIISKNNNSKEINTREYIKRDNLYLIYMGWILLIFALPYKIYLDIQKIQISMQFGYLSVFKIEQNGILAFFSEMYLVAIVMLIFAYEEKNNKRLSLSIYIASIFYLLFTMVSGGRGKAVISICVISYFYLGYFKKIKFKNLVVILVALYFFLKIMNIVSFLRVEGINSIEQIIKALNSNNNVILNTIMEFGGTIQTPYQSIVQPNAKIVNTYFAGLASIFPNYNDLLSKYINLAHFVKNLNGSAMGGSYIGELFFNFKNFGVFGGLVIGFFINLISQKIELLMYQKRYYTLTYLIMPISTLLWWVRDAFYPIYRNFIWCSVIIFSLHFCVNLYFKTRQLKL